MRCGLPSSQAGNSSITSALGCTQLTGRQSKHHVCAWSASTLEDSLSATWALGSPSTQAST